MSKMIYFVEDKPKFLPSLVGAIKIVSIGSIAFALSLGMATYTICSLVKKHKEPEEE